MLIPFITTASGVAIENAFATIGNVSCNTYTLAVGTEGAQVKRSSEYTIAIYLSEEMYAAGAKPVETRSIVLDGYPRDLKPEDVLSAQEV